MVALVVALMFVTAASSAIGTPAADALFFTRFGVRFLPYMYLILGVITITLAMLITVLLGRIPRHRLYLAIPLVLGAGILLSRAVLVLEFSGFYPILWLEVSAIWTLQGLFTWGIAGSICDTRQAKRLFPLFGAGSILGLAAGGLATRPLVLLVGTENLLLIWAGGFVTAFYVGKILLNPGLAASRQVARKKAGRQKVGPVAELLSGYWYVRRSALLRWLSLVALLFGVLLYALAFPFSEAAANRFPEADALSGFLGAFQGATTGLAFLASLFLANRLYARLGITSMVVVYTGIFLLGYLTLSISANFFTLVGFRFLQVLWYQGIGLTAYQAIYNAVPPHKRDQTRAFIDGVLGQIGIILAGIYLLLSQRILSDPQIFLGAAFVAALAMYFALRSSQAYRGALVAALREGQPQLFVSEEEPFGGFKRDAAAMAAVVAGISNPDPIVRRVSAEILGNIPVPEARDVLVQALEDEDAQVRAALLRSLSQARAVPALLEILTCLDDPEPVVRLEALFALRALAGYTRGLISQIAPLLEDVDDTVRANAAVTLLRHGPNGEAEALLSRMAADQNAIARQEALRAIADWGQPASYDLAAGLVQDPVPAVRRMAVRAVANTDPSRCVALLVSMLGDDNPLVRREAAEAIRIIGQPALPLTVESLQDPARQEGVLLTLEQFPTGSIAADLETFVLAKKQRALHYHRLAIQTQTDRQGGPHELLYLSILRKSRQEGAYALRAFGLLHEQTAVATALEHLDDPNPDGRANALEILESVKGSQLIQDLFPLWETADPAGSSDSNWLSEVLQDEDSWLRACGVLLVAERPDADGGGRLAEMAAHDPSLLVREAAASVIKGEQELETLQTISIMERILFLRRVPLFADLSPTDLKHVARAARENLFHDGEVIVRQGETGDVLYLIVSGDVSVQVESEDGVRIEVARRGLGEYVGEMAILSHEPRMATLIADGDVRTLCLEQESFEGILRERPETSLAVMRVLCSRLREHTLDH